MLHKRCVEEIVRLQHAAGNHAEAIQELARVCSWIREMQRGTR
jgi:hypothetical protein